MAVLKMTSRCGNLDNTKSKKKRKGFTLIEMLIVVAIIGILAGIVAIKYGDVQKKARENADYANASNIATAVYMAQSDGMGDSEITVEKLVEKKYLSSAPKPQSVEATSYKITLENGVLKITAGNTGEEKTFYPK